jgi:proteasome assembly chaperone 4
MKSTSTNFVSHSFTGEAAGVTINYRVLKMQDSLFIYIGKKDEEALNGLAVGLLPPFNEREAISTSILESPESQDLAQKLAVRLKKPIFISCNLNVDRLIAPVIEKHLVQEIKERSEFF